MHPSTPNTAPVKDDKVSPRREHMLIAGPCSAETEKQVMETAAEIAHLNISWFRAGIWKPRTSPDSFEGVGSEALTWLSNVRKEYGILVTTEVANARHVEEALKHDIDLLWIGARSTVNPFTVQEIADALRGVEVDVMIKNPINPDVELWSGAIERVLRAGVKATMTCHRGFDVYGKSVYRNTPLWEIPIEIKRRFPDIPMICDPSHISGARPYIKPISQKALNLGYEGLMIETHQNPSEAWSDARQQLSPQQLEELMRELHFKQRETENTEYHNRIALLRDEMDEIDQKLLDLLSSRMETSKQIGELKTENNLPFYQYDRWSEIIKHCITHAEELGLNEDFVMKLFNLIHLESIDIQGE